MAKKLTAEAKRKYVKGGGAACPFCGSKSLDASPMQVDGPTAWSDLKCEDCGETWWDVYRLADVERK